MKVAQASITLMMSPLPHTSISQAHRTTWQTAEWKHGDVNL